MSTHTSCGSVVSWYVRDVQRRRCKLFNPSRALHLLQECVSVIFHVETTYRASVESGVGIIRASRVKREVR